MKKPKVKIQTGYTLVQDMGLGIGEVFQIGTGKKAFKMRYAGICEHNGIIYDRLEPVV